MEQTRIQMFEQQIYPELFAEAAENMIDLFAKNKKKITQEWKEILQQYMEQLASLQEEDAAPPIQEMNLSFLYTAMEEGHPEFRIDSYGEGGRVTGQSILTGSIPAHWIADGPKTLAEQLAERARQENLRGYVRAAEIDQLRLRAVRSMLLCFAVRFKYVVQDMIDFQSLAKIKKEPCFLIQIGEYMDWLKTIYAVQPVVDIFNCERSTDLRFRRFHAIHYSDKQFQELNLSQSDFKDCVFQNSSMEGCIMSDCMFDGCKFEKIKINDTWMQGCIFVDCVFCQVTFEKTVFSKEKNDDDSLEYFEPAEFHSCSFQDVKLERCSTKGCHVKNCDAHNIDSDGCSTADSGFEGLVDKEEQNGIF